MGAKVGEGKGRVEHAALWVHVPASLTSFIFLSVRLKKSVVDILYTIAPVT